MDYCRHMCRHFMLLWACLFPLIVVNCILLGRAEAFAAKNGPVPSFFDGLGMGLGFTLALTILGGVREFLGTGKLFDIAIMPEQYGMFDFRSRTGSLHCIGIPYCDCE